jgi:hypothetical protein
MLARRALAAPLLLPGYLQLTGLHPLRAPSPHVRLFVCFLDFNLHAIFAFGEFARNVVLPVTGHAAKDCNNSDTHRAYQAPPATSAITTGAHTPLTAYARP